MKTRRFFATALASLLIIAMMVAVFAGCNSSNEPEKTPANNGNDNSESIDNKQPVDDEEPTEIVFYLIEHTSTPEGKERVAAAINEITEKEINVHVNFQFAQMGDYVNTVQMAISGGEQVDLCHVYLWYGCSFSSMTSKNQLTELTDLFANHGPDVYELVSPYLGAFTVDGGVYALPVYRDWNATDFLFARADVLEELGLTEKFNNLTSWSEYEEILEAVSKAKNDEGMYGVGSQGTVAINPGGGVMWNSDKFTDVDLYDGLGDGLALLYCDVDGEGKVECIWDQESAVYMLEMIAGWKEKGYVYPDSEITEISNMDLIGKTQSLVFSEIVSSEIGADVTWSSAAGTEILALPLASAPLSSSPFTRWACGIPITTEEPEAAMKFLNLMYTNAEIMNLLDWGVEGIDYIIGEDGTAEYPNGDANVSFHRNDFAFGNYFLALPWSGSLGGSDFRKLAMEDLKSATISPYLGFSVKTSDLEVVFANLSAVNDQYKKQLVCGGYTEELFREYKDKLETAGINEYIAAVQTQMDAWLASK